MAFDEQGFRSRMEQAFQDMIGTAMGYYNRGDVSSYNSVAGLINSSRANVDNIVGLAKQAGLNPTTDFDMFKSAVFGNPTDLQGIREKAASAQQLADQNAQLQAARDKMATQTFGSPTATLSQALSSPTSDLGQLSTALKQQQTDIFQQNLAPLANMSLNAQGLMNSGANVELQSKALAGLERDRQSQLLNAALGARGQMQGLERSDLLGSIGYSQQALSNLSDIQRTGIEMNFQQQLEQRREQLAMELSQYRGGSGLMGGLSGAMGGAMTGFALGGPIGMGIGAAAGGFLGSQNPQGGQMIGQLGTAFGSAYQPRRYSGYSNYPSGGGVRSYGYNQ